MCIKGAFESACDLEPLSNVTLQLGEINKHAYIKHCVSSALHREMLLVAVIFKNQSS